MLVLKFIKSDETGRHIDTSLSCETVEVIHCNDGFIITAYKTLIHKDGVEYRLSKNTIDSYRTCFVINDTGKTVDKYSV